MSSAPGSTKKLDDELHLRAAARASNELVPAQPAVESGSGGQPAAGQARTLPGGKIRRRRHNIGGRSAFQPGHAVGAAGHTQAAARTRFRIDDGLAQYLEATPSAAAAR